ncbi:glycosyltransferase family 25 protein [Cohaesibacter sp. CAU 1516]|uniref:glycosyltransferase family 25 protein n=1 Tax=Cohaesibacter sp. CAU 1516 TaxID=2576038 RepID=UPI001484C96D|nr:glycosyltransferase family 25 protein [Cohaesibacter sp. CAU 1516]
MRFFLINLDRDNDRFIYMQEALKPYGITPERVPACLGLAMDECLKPFFLDDAGEIASAMSKGEIGCYASHLTILKRIVDEDIKEPVLVMEDDLRFEANFRPLMAAIDTLPEDWEIVRLSNPAKAHFKTVSNLPGAAGEIVLYWRVPNNTGAYVINQSGARKFLGYQTRRMRPVDEDLRRPWEHGLTTYGVLPAPITSNIFDSTIDAIGGDRSLPARKRFADAGNHYGQEWRYRVRTFGLFGCLKAMLATLLFKARYKKRSRH